MRSTSTWKTNGILWVLLLLLVGLILCPLITVFARAVIIDGRLDLSQAWSIIADKENLQTIFNSLLLGVCVVLCSTVIAAPTAYLLARTQLAKTPLDGYRVHGALYDAALHRLHGLDPVHAETGPVPAAVSHDRLLL